MYHLWVTLRLAIMLMNMFANGIMYQDTLLYNYISKILVWYVYMKNPLFQTQSPRFSKRAILCCLSNTGKVKHLLKPPAHTSFSVTTETIS